MDPNLKILDDDADAKRWEGLNKKGELLTKETFESWTGELHNLLIFAGLFSGIVAAFTVEASKIVQGDPAQTSILLLQTIIQQLHNQSNPQPNLAINLNPEAAPSLYAQRINALYSVSLALSLVAVVGGIVCLQWLRQFGKNITGVSNKEDLFLQYQRHRSLRSWGVVALLNMLPLFLLVALGLFFVGFMISQWESNSFASIPVTVLVAILGAFILLTSILPTSQLIWHTSGISPSQWISPPVLCPYRSPQSWLFHLLLQGLTYVFNWLKWLNQRSKWLKCMESIHSWMDYDTRSVKRWKESAGAVGSIYHQLSWISREYRQTTKVAEDAYYCMVFASCQVSRMKLKEKEHNTVRWKWEELDLLTSFTDNNDNGVHWRALCIKGIVEARAECNTSLENTGVQAWSDVVALVSSFSYSNQRGFIRDISNSLESSETTRITPESAVAIACHMIDHNLLDWFETRPILEGLCKCRPTTLPPIRHLVDKYLDVYMKVGSEHAYRSLIGAFTRAFPSVDSSDYEALAPILGDLLVERDECIIYSFYTDMFLDIIQGLASKHLIGRDKSLNRIFLYTKHIIKYSYGLSDGLPLLKSTFSAILSAAKEYRQYSLAPSRDLVLHPDKFTIPFTYPNPRQDEDLNHVWASIYDFNERLKDLWHIHQHVEPGGEGSSKIEECIGTSDDDLQDETTGQVTSAIHSTTDLLMVTTPEPIKSITPGVTVSPILPPLSQDSEHYSSNNNSIICFYPHTREEVIALQVCVECD